MLLMFVIAYSQTITVNGKVTDDKNTPIPDASVIEKGTNNGTVILNDGSFTLKVKPNALLTRHLQEAPRL